MFFLRSIPPKYPSVSMWEAEQWRDGLKDEYFAFFLQSLPLPSSLHVVQLHRKREGGERKCVIREFILGIAIGLEHQGHLMENTEEIVFKWDWLRAVTSCFLAINGKNIYIYQVVNIVSVICHCRNRLFVFLISQQKLTIKYSILRNEDNVSVSVKSLA